MIVYTKLDTHENRIQQGSKSTQKDTQWHIESAVIKGRVDSLYKYLLD